MGLEGISPFSALFFAFLRFFGANLPVFYTFLRFFALLAWNKGQITAIYCQNGEFHYDPVCTDPVENFPNFYACFKGYFGRVRERINGDLKRVI